MSAKRKRQPSPKKPLTAVEFVPPPPTVFGDVDVARYEGVVGSIQRAKEAVRALAAAIDQADKPLITGADVIRLNNESKKAILAIEGTVHFVCWASAGLLDIPPD